jgi:hypothetical protein
MENQVSRKKNIEAEKEECCIIIHIIDWCGIKQKNKATVTLFDHATSDSLATLAASQQKVADAKLQQIMRDNESKMAATAAMAEHADLDLRMKKFQTLMDIREKNLSLTNEQIIQMFPMLADFVNILK